MPARAARTAARRAQGEPSRRRVALSAPLLWARRRARAQRQPRPAEAGRPLAAPPARQRADSLVLAAPWLDTLAAWDARLRLWAMLRALREHALGRRGSPPRPQWQHVTLPSAQPKSPTSPLSALRRSQPPDHLATLFMLGAAPEHLPPPMLPVSSGGDHGPATDGSGGGGGGSGGGDGIPLHPELRLGGAWRGRRRHFSFRCSRRWGGHVEYVCTACTPHTPPLALHCTAHSASCARACARACACACARADVQVQPDGACRRGLDLARRAAPRKSPTLQRLPRRVRTVSTHVLS